MESFEYTMSSFLIYSTVIYVIIVYTLHMFLYFCLKMSNRVYLKCCKILYSTMSSPMEQLTLTVLRSGS